MLRGSFSRCMRTADSSDLKILTAVLPNWNQTPRMFWIAAILNEVAKSTETSNELDDLCSVPGSCSSPFVAMGGKSWSLTSIPVWRLHAGGQRCTDSVSNSDISLLQEQRSLSGTEAARCSPGVALCSWRPHLEFNDSSSLNSLQRSAINFAHIWNFPCLNFIHRDEGGF